MKKAVITGDIINSTQLTVVENNQLIKGLQNIIDALEKTEELQGEIFRGDSIQCLLQNPKNALKTALLIKTYVKGIIALHDEKYDLISTVNKNNRSSIYDIRLAIGVGEVIDAKEKLSISQGEAFNLSGRLLDEMKNKQTIAIKTNDKNNNEFETSLKLLDFIISNTTQNQCEVIYHKLNGKTEQEISEIIGVNQSAINQRSNSSGWNAIHSLIQRFEEVYG